MKKLRNILKEIGTLDSGSRIMAQKRLDQLTKPPGSLGRLEELAAWYVHVTGKIPVLPFKKMVFTFAADHGVVEEKVSAYPKAVTAQMVYNFLREGAAINVLARHVGAEVRIVDMGVDYDFGLLPGLLGRKISHGTRNMARGPAMSRNEAEAAVNTGIELAEEAARNGVNLLGMGEMGIGNTTASSAITAVMTGSPVDIVTGKGTGIDNQTLFHKQAIIQKAIKVNRPLSDDPMDVLSKIGGYEIGGIVGLILGAAAHRVPVVIDGFISTAATLIAVALKPEIKPYLLASHQSVEPGHRIALSVLGLRPLLDLDMRLGEGTGAALGIGMVEAAIRILIEMASFEEAGVSEKKE